MDVNNPTGRGGLLAIDVGSLENYNITLLPDGRMLYSENDDQAAFVSVMDLRSRTGAMRVRIGSRSAQPDAPSLTRMQALQGQQFDGP